MTTAVVSAQQGAMLEQVLIGGDLSRLKPEDRVMYYKQVCESTGLNPLTKPFEYITLNGKLTLYALRSCTEQLRKIHGVSILIVSREVVEDCYVVTARATDAKGRNDESIGAVPIAGVKGEARSNAMMKAETKAKRRVTLAICGLGMLDESEADSIAGAHYPSPGSVTAGALAALPGKTQDAIVETATQVKALLANDQAADAYALWQSSKFDNDQKVAFWSQLDSKQRGVLGRMAEAEEAQNKGVISEPMKKRLEAKIKEMGYEREQVKKYCSAEWGTEHFSELTREQYAALDLEMDKHNPALDAPAQTVSTAATPSAESVAGAPMLSAEQCRNILAYCEQLGVNVSRLLLKLKVASIEEIPAGYYDRCITFIDNAAKVKS